MTIDELRLALQAEITDGGLRADGVRAWTEHVIYDPGDDTEPFEPFDYHHVVAHRLAGDRTIGYTMDLSTQLLEQAKPDHVVGVLVLDLNDGLDRTNA